MNLKQLEAFIKVSDSKSFSKAAQELYLTQPTVSAHIQTLEKELKVLEFPFSQDGSGRNLNLVYNKNYKLPAAAEHVRELIIEKYELQKQSLQ